MALPDTQMFANRLRKNYRHLQKWARREGVMCFRVYDADIPEFPLAVDIYGKFLYVAEYQRKHPLTDEEYPLWRAGCIEELKTVFERTGSQIFFKERKQQKGLQQYEKQAQRQHEIIVEENGLKFIVNLSDYLDTGLFLDHRLTRQMVREKAAGKNMLNLFAYTGSFSVYAAAGGAASTTTIDLSNTYLEWAQRNMTLNGFEGPQHRFARADALAWLRQPVEALYDLVVLDPPTFSNSKSMRGILDTQRDHAEMINHCLRRMTPGGLLYFSTNYRRFRLDETAIQGAVIRDISARTIPEDFRNARIHYCFEIIKQ